MYLVSVRCIVAWLLSLVEQVIANWAAVSGGLVGLLDLFWGILVRHKRKVMEIGDVVRTTFQWTCVDLVETGQLLAITHWLKTFYTISVASRNTAPSCLIFEGHHHCNSCIAWIYQIWLFIANVILLGPLWYLISSCTHAFTFLQMIYGYMDTCSFHKS